MFVSVLCIIYQVADVKSSQVYNLLYFIRIRMLPYNKIFCILNNKFLLIYVNKITSLVRNNAFYEMIHEPAEERVILKYSDDFIFGNDQGFIVEDLDIFVKGEGGILILLKCNNLKLKFMLIILKLILI